MSKMWSSVGRKCLGMWTISSANVFNVRFMVAGGDGMWPNVIKMFINVGNWMFINAELMVHMLEIECS